MFRIAELVVAACCLAHEIGHLLLPTAAHAAERDHAGAAQPHGLATCGTRRVAIPGCQRTQMAEALPTTWLRPDETSNGAASCLPI